MRRQPQVHRDDGGLITPKLRHGRLAVAGDDRFVVFERPAHLLLQRGIVFDDQQRPARFTQCCTPSVACASAGAGAPSDCGKSTRTVVPVPSTLSTSRSPPRLRTY